MRTEKTKKHGPKHKIDAEKLFYKNYFPIFSTFQEFQRVHSAYSFKE